MGCWHYSIDIIRERKPVYTIFRDKSRELDETSGYGAVSNI